MLACGVVPIHLVRVAVLSRDSLDDFYHLPESPPPEFECSLCSGERHLRREGVRAAAEELAAAPRHPDLRTRDGQPLDEQMAGFEWR